MISSNIAKYRSIGFTLLFIGFLLIIIASLLLVIYFSTGGTKVETGVSGCIIIFFIPICFVQGTPGVLPYILLLTILIVISIIVLFVVFSLIYTFIYRKSYIPTQIHK